MGTKRAVLLAGALALAAAPGHAATRTVDRTKPVVRFTTADGATLIGLPDEKLPNPAAKAYTHVVGTSSDAGSIRTMTATFFQCTQWSSGSSGDTCSWTGAGSQPSDDPNLREGPLSWHCTNNKKTSCNWEIRVPLVPSGYLVAVNATDYAGNRGGNLIVITVA
jgi:hypothetical protein